MIYKILESIAAPTISDSALILLIFFSIIILTVIVLAIVITSIYFTLKKYQKQISEKIYPVVEFEEKRFSLLKDCFKDITSRNYDYNDKFNDVILEISDIFEKDIVSKRSYAKNSMDLMFHYYLKYLKEYDLQSELSEKVNEMFKEQENVYVEYNKKARVYNSLLSMTIMKPFTKKFSKALIF